MIIIMIMNNDNDNYDNDNDNNCFNRLLEDFEIALPVSDTKYLVQSNLSAKQPQLMLPTGNVLRRRYTMPYAPVGFWRRLVLHLLLYREEMIDWQQHDISAQGKVRIFQIC